MGEVQKERARAGKDGEQPGEVILGTMLERQKVGIWVILSGCRSGTHRTQEGISGSTGLGQQGFPSMLQEVSHLNTPRVLLVNTAWTGRQEPFLASICWR